jgi:hypothetical protein
VEVERFGEGGRRWWCILNGSISAREGRRPDEALPEDEVKLASSSYLHRK